MKLRSHGRTVQRWTAAAVLALAWPGGALAASGAASWRPLYDAVMMWVNFLILAALLVKYLRRPLRDFLEDYRGQVARDLERLEAQRRQAAAAIQSFGDALEERRRDSEAFRLRMQRRGERERQEIIAEAGRQAERLLEKARLQMDVRIREARDAIRREIVDAAAARALAELPGRLEPLLQERWVERALQAMPAFSGSKTSH